MTEPEYHDALTQPAAFTHLWAQVLMQAIHDATKGVSSGMNRTQRIIHIEQARTFLTKPNPDFTEVCSLAGLDPESVRERAVRLIAQSPSVDELVGDAGAQPPRKPRGRGVAGKLYTVGETSLPISAWAARLGMSPASIHTRLHKGWTIEEAMTVPKGSERPKATVH